MKPLTEPKARENGYFWCGPIAVSAATGCFLEDVEEGIIDHRNNLQNKPFKGKVTWSDSYELWHAVKRLGFECREVWTISMHLQNIGMSFAERFNRRCPNHVNPTLNQWLKSRTPEEMKRTYLVLVTDHWVTIRGRKMVDSKYRNPTFLGQVKHHKRKRVQHVLEVYKP